MRSLLELSLTGTLKVISASETACNLHEMHEVLLEYSHVEFSKTWCGCQAAPALSIIDHRRPFRHLQDMIIVQSHSWLGRRPFDTKVDLQVLCGEQLFRRKKKSVSFIILLLEPFNTSNLHSFAHTSTNHNTDNSNSKGKAVAATATALAAGCILA